MNMHVEKAGIYTDLAGLQDIKRLPQKDSDEALRAVAKQFESIFVNMMMKSMREGNAVFEEGGLNDSNESKFYRDMFDQQLSLSLSTGNGIGVAEALVRQLKQSYGSPDSSQASSQPPSQTTSQLLSQPFSQTVPQTLGLTETSVAVGNTTSSIPKQAASPIETSSATKDFENPQQFVDHLYPKVEKIAKKIGVDPTYLLSQAALETGWGRKMITNADGSNSFNLFGIKADSRWQGNVTQVSTLEYRNGIAQRDQATFRSYGSFEESLEDYAEFLQGNGRYQKALTVAEDPERFFEELQQAGYATDPAYAKKIADIAKRNLFTLLHQADSV